MQDNQFYLNWLKRHNLIVASQITGQYRTAYVTTSGARAGPAREESDNPSRPAPREKIGLCR